MTLKSIINLYMKVLKKKKILIFGDYDVDGYSSVYLFMIL